CWYDHSIASILEYPSTFLQKCERLVQSEAASSWLVCSQSIPDCRIDACSISQDQQQLFLEVLPKGLDGLHAHLGLETPVFLQAQFERGIMLGSDEKV